MKNLDALITKYTSGLITRNELKGLVFKEAFITTAEICGSNSPEFLGVLQRINEGYYIYVVEQLGG